MSAVSNMELPSLGYEGNRRGEAGSREPRSVLSALGPEQLLLEVVVVGLPRAPGAVKPRLGPQRLSGERSRVPPVREGQRGRLTGSADRTVVLDGKRLDLDDLSPRVGVRLEGRVGDHDCRFERSVERRRSLDRR